MAAPRRHHHRLPSPVVKYHGLARRYLMPLGFLMRPLLNGGTLGRRVGPSLVGIEDQKGNQLLELITLNEAELSKVAPLTHALVVARRNENKNLLVFSRHRQYWELAGGLIDAGETPRDCAVRELREESGLACDPASFRLVGAAKSSSSPAGSTVRFTLNTALFM
jgi:hypothetical protein